MTDSFVPDRPVICPYDSNHSIASSRLQRHIIKCSKNFPPGYRLCCPYNATHRLPESEVEKHIFECPDRIYFDRYLYEGSRISVENANIENRSVIECDECWDNHDGTLYELSSISDRSEVCAKPSLPMNNFAASPEEPPEVIPEARSTLRRPLGRPEALMVDESGDSAMEDIESVTSGMNFGRGRLLNIYKKEMLYGAGRGGGSVRNGNSM